MEAKKWTDSDLQTAFEDGCKFLHLEDLKEFLLKKNKENMKAFDNGFPSWQETHFEVVQRIALEISKDEPKGVVADKHDAQGHGGLYELAEELTDEFEKINKHREWDGDFFDSIDEFLNKKL